MIIAVLDMQLSIAVINSECAPRSSPPTTPLPYSAVQKAAL